MNEIEKAIELLETGSKMPTIPHTADEIDTACKFAVEALQEMAERTPATVISSDDDFYHFCSKCNNEVYKKDKYCHTCGCELKWGKK